MKKTILLLVFLLLGLCTAHAESPDSVYEVLSGLLSERTFTLTVSAESDTDALNLIIAQYGTVFCTLGQEDNEIHLKASCDGDAFLNAALSKEGVSFQTNLIKNRTFACSWPELEPSILYEADAFSVTMTGPDHELIRFNCQVQGTDPSDCQVEIDIGYITGPGNVHSLWDSITSKDGESSREFYFTFSEEEYGIAGDGTASVETAENGGITLTREENCTVMYQEDELGDITFRSTLNIQ